MLVLSRKVGEQVLIDGNIVVTINRIDGNRVSLGIQAPPEVRIVREELRPFGDEAPVPSVGRNRLAGHLPVMSR